MGIIIPPPLFFHMRKQTQSVHQKDLQAWRGQNFGAGKYLFLTVGHLLSSITMYRMEKSSPLLISLQKESASLMSDSFSSVLILTLFPFNQGLTVPKFQPSHHEAYYFHRARQKSSPANSTIRFIRCS